MADYADLVEYIVRSIVDHPDAVEIEMVPSRGRSDTVEIRLDPEDIGRVIGKSGRNIEAIRSVVKVAAIRDHRHVNVEVITDDELAPTSDEPSSDSGEPEPEETSTDGSSPDGSGNEVAG